MTARSKAVIKSYFTTGSRPTQSQFDDLVDSYTDAGLSPDFPTVVTADSAKVLRVNPGAVDFGLGMRIPTAVSADTTKIVKVNSAGDGFEYGAKLPAFTASKFGAIVVQNTADDGFDFVTSQGTSGQVLTSNGADALPSFQTPAVVTTDVTCAQVTDATDIVLSTAPTQANVGSTVSLTIPTKGMIQLKFLGEVLLATNSNSMIFGVRIGGTNYWPDSVEVSAANYIRSVDAAIGTSSAKAVGTGDYTGIFQNGAVDLSIEKLSIPTGAQTVQIIAAKVNGTAMTVKGTSTTTLVNIAVYDHT